MNSSAILDLINDLESRFAVDQWTAGGIRIWPYLRIRLFFSLFFEYQTSCEASGPPPLVRIGRLLNGLARFSYAALADARKNRWPRGHADVVLVSGGRSYAFLDGSWYEKFCDPLIERFSAQGVSTFLVSPTFTCHVPRHSPSLFIEPFLSATRLSNRIFTGAAPANDALQREYPAYRTYLEGRNLRLTVSSLTAIQRDATVILRLASGYRRLLQRTTPALLFIVDYYSLEGMAVMLACRQLGIPSIDLQHGRQGELHIAYGRWRRVPTEGYELLPSRFWVWGEREARTVERWNAEVTDYHRPVVGGNLWLEMWLSGEQETVRGYDRHLRSRLASYPGSRNILVTLQTNMADEKTLGPLLAAMRHSPRAWRWWVRLHPCMLSERAAVRKMLVRNGITDAELDSATELPLYALLRHLDLHVTLSSTTVLEAELFGMPSVVISEYGEEFYLDQFASGWAVTAFTDRDILAAVARQLEARSGLRQRIPAPPVSPQGFDEMLKLVRRHPMGNLKKQGAAS